MIRVREGDSTPTVSKDAAINAVFGRRGSHMAASSDEDQRSSTTSP